MTKVEKNKSSQVGGEWRVETKERQEKLKINMQMAIRKKKKTQQKGN